MGTVSKCRDRLKIKIFKTQLEEPGKLMNGLTVFGYMAEPAVIIKEMKHSASVVG